MILTETAITALGGELGEKGVLVRDGEGDFWQRELMVHRARPNAGLVEGSCHLVVSQ